MLKRITSSKSVHFLVLAALLAGLLAAAPVSAEPVTQSSAVTAPTLAASQGTPAPLPYKERIPAQPAKAPATLGVPSVNVATPSISPTASADGITKQLAPRPSLSASNVDVFADPTSNGSHVAVVYSGDVNERTVDAWRDADGPLVQSASGFTARRSGGAQITFPATLSAASPVRLDVSGGSLTMVPRGVTPTVGTQVGTGIFYAGALPSTDIKELPTSGGYEELLVLNSAQASPNITWDVTTSNVTLAATNGEIAVLSGSKTVARIPVSTITDARGATITQPLLLDTSANTLSLAINPKFLATARYPITVDPGGSSTLSASRDTYTDSALPSTSFETATSMYVKGTSPTQYSFLNFDTTALTNAARLVYAADLKLKNVSGTATTTARQVTAAWPATMSYSNQPAVAAADTASTTGTAGGTWTWTLGSLYQHYIEGSWTNYGARLATTGAQTRFYSKETGTSANRPSLVVSYNDLPPAPTLGAPNATITTDSPALHATAIPVDPNGDAVLLKFQIALCPLVGQVADCNQANFGSPVWTSSWVDKRSARIPAGILVAGSTYSWRGISRDVCGASFCSAAPGETTLFSLTDAAGVTHAAPTSAPKTTQVVTTALGRDSRYQMWNQQIGNNVSMAVNAANGNLNLDVPFDMLSTRLGDVQYGMTYNSLSTAADDLGTGWSLYATPDGMSVPTSIVDDTASDSVKITSATGAIMTFVQSDTGSGLYVGQGNGVTAGTVARTGANGLLFSYFPASGGKINFDSSGRVTKVQTVKTTPSQAAAGGYLTYTYGNAHLLSVADPDGRTITFTWTSNMLDKVTAQDGRIFEVTQNATSISFVDPAGASVAVVRDGSFRPTEIKDATVISHGGTGWLVTYTSPTDASVATIKAPPGGALTSPTPWTFTRIGPFFGTNASQGTVTDPRGSGTSTFTQLTDFNTVGLPIRVAGPADQNGYWPVEVKLWDTNGNLQCERSAAANAIYAKTPTNCNVDEAGADYPELSTKFSYQAVTPFERTKVTGAAPAAGGAQPVTDFTYLSTNGLSYSNYDNVTMSGIPVATGIWNTSLAQNYGTGSPTGVASGDNWSVRYDGFLDVVPGTYKFRAYSNDGIEVIADTATLTSCFGTTQVATNYNCGSNQNAVLTVATAGQIPVTIFYSELTGSASFDVQWDGGTGGAFSTIPLNKMHPTENPEASSIGAKIDDGTANGVHLTRARTFTGDDQKVTGLPGSVTSSGGAASTTRAMVYDNYGRLKDDTTASGTGAAATTSRTYSQTQCFLTQDGPLPGAHIDQTCNFRGQPTSTTTAVRAVASQPLQSRVTSYTYDLMGRMLTEDPPSTSLTTNTYDLAGRVLTTTEALVSGANRVTTNTYDDAGRLLSVSTTDGGTVNYTYDWAGNQLTRSDSRNAAWKTTSTFDALNRQISSTSPSGLVTATVYTLSAAANKEDRTQPNGVTTTTNFDVRGQVTSEKTGSLTAATYLFDEEGNATKTTDPSGAESISTYDALGNEKTTRITLPGAGNYATTANTYDAASSLTSTDGPRTGTGDTVNFTYDGAGNLLTVQQAGLATPNTTAYAYDDANELVKVDQPLVTGTSFVHTFTYGNDGNQLTSADARGTITSTYDDGGRLLTESLPNGVAKTHTYDAQGNELSVTVTKAGFPAATRTFIYDLAGNMTRATQGSKVIDFTYDSDGRMTGTSTDAGDASTQAYDSVTGSTSSITTVAGTVNLTWGANGLLAGVQDPFSNQTTNYTWDTAGRLTGRTDPAGLTWARTYDAANRLDTQTINNSGGQIAAFDLGYDEAGNVTSRAETVKTPAGTNLAGSGTWTYGYDAANRMTSSTDPSSVQTTYGYDTAGNRTSVKVGAAAAVTTTYDSASLPASSSDGTTYTYDAMGTLTASDKSGGTTGDRCYAYDAFGLLAAMRKDATTGCGSGTGDVTYGYDALGRTTSRVGTATTTNTYELDGESLAREVTGASTTLYVSGPEGPLASSTAGAVRYFTKDLHGDTVGTVNSTGAVTASKLYSPWGEAAASSGESTTLGFQSQATDIDTGYVDMTTRLYDPAGGRFTSRDVLFGDTSGPASMNQYGYGEGSPVTNDDPEGMRARCHIDVWPAGGSSIIAGQSNTTANAQFKCTAKFALYNGHVRLEHKVNGNWAWWATNPFDEPTECENQTSCMWTALKWDCPAHAEIRAVLTRVYVVDRAGQVSHIHHNIVTGSKKPCD